MLVFLKTLKTFSALLHELTGQTNVHGKSIDCALGSSSVLARQ